MHFHEPASHGSTTELPHRDRTPATSILQKPLGELISANQLADLLCISERSLYRLKSTHLLPEPIRLGGNVRWRLYEIRKWIEQGCPKPDPCK
jgi:predicted DNA-binding transcriptional regulator AlpA